MRKWYIPLALVLGGVVWFASPGTAATQLLGTAGLIQGERITLWLDRVNSPVQCEILNITNEFLGCAVVRGDGGVALDPPARVSWYNLRFVTRIQKAVKE